MSSTKTVVGALAVAGTVYAAQAEYQQCGGIGWSGGTICVSPWVCTVLNNYYSQCLPGSSSASTTKASTTTTTTKSTTVSTSSKTTTTSVSSKPTTSSSSTSVKGSSTSSSSSAGPTASIVPGNPFTKPGLAHTYYANEISTAVAAFQSQGDSVNAAKAASVANIPTFYWLDTMSKVPTMASILEAAGTTKLAQFVVYDLPDRDCAADASNGEYSIADNGQANYFAYIDAIKAQIEAYPNVQVVIVYEPDSLPNLVTNLSVQKCANAETTYIACEEYGIKTLNLPNVTIYMDAGHAGWLGYTSNAGPAAKLFAQVYQAAGSPAAVRGLVTNVANYNAFNNGGNPDPITVGSYDPAADEQQYQAEMVPLLQAAGFPAQFITDTGRNGQQNLRLAWGDWCNVKGAGFGIRPTTDTGTTYTDAFVWVKPGGECDGTSNSSAPRYDPHCSLADADQPAPQAGTWFEEYFETLVKQANPPL